MGVIRSGFIKSLLLLLFAVHYTSIAFFTHAHTIDNRIVIHSHPFNPFSEKSTNHEHTEKEIFHISILSHLDVLPDILNIDLTILCLPKDKETDNYSDQHFDIFQNYIFLLRAPPALV